MKILLIGSTGQLGGDLLRNNPGHEIVAPDRTRLDLERTEQIDTWIREFGPEVLVNCAAFHNVPLCETEPEKAFRINCTAVGRLASLCRKHAVRLVTFSTDYVFGGEKRTPYIESDLPHPLQIYGITRLAGEHAAMAAAPEHATIIRTCGLYGRSGASSKGGNFVDKRIAEAATPGILEMSSDQTVSPTSTEDLSRAVFALLAHPRWVAGIYHLVNEGDCTWYEFARAIYGYLGMKVDLRPVDRRGLSDKMRRPLYSVLANSRASALGISLPSWRSALGRYLEECHPRSQVQAQR
jgi:dTDP-4-dehydrorhamnose reductase